MRASSHRCGARCVRRARCISAAPEADAARMMHRLHQIRKAAIRPSTLGPSDACIALAVRRGGGILVHPSALDAGRAETSPPLSVRRPHSPATGPRPRTRRPAYPRSGRCSSGRPPAMCVSRSTSTPRTSRNRSSSAWQAAAVLGDAVDGAVALDQADDAVGAEDRLGEVALLVLDDGQLARPVERAARRPARRSASRWRTRSPGRRRAPRTRRRPAPRHRSHGWPRAGPSGQPVVVGREEVLGGIGDVVDVARPADAVPHRRRLTRPAVSSAWSCCRTPVRLAPRRPPSSSGADGPSWRSWTTGCAAARTPMAPGRARSATSTRRAGDGSVADGAAGIVRALRGSDIVREG